MNDTQWQRAVVEKAGFICTGCDRDFSYECYFEKGVNQYVCGHHKQTKKAHPELRYDLNNGVCLCLWCHQKVHNGTLKL